MKKCLKTIQNTDVIKKVGVALSELESCDKNCLKCIRYYSIDIDHYTTSCADENDIEFILYVRDNLTDQKKKLFKDHGSDCSRGTVNFDHIFLVLQIHKKETFKKGLGARFT